MRKASVQLSPDPILGFSASLLDMVFPLI